jgi:hypothetical protein
MTVVSRQLLLSEPAVAAVADAAARMPVLTIARDRWAASCAALLGFFCFMPYPAINVGRQSAIQIGNILTVLLVLPAAAMLWRRRPFVLYTVMMVPLLASTLAVAASGSEDLELSLKITAALVLSMMSIWAAQLFVPRYGLEMLSGIALATVLHVAVGLWQFQSFKSETFPLVELYVNQSFLSVQTHVNTIARYIQRPFGIFPEPSAMSSSLAPWVVLWAAYFCDIIRFKREPTRFQRFLFAGAALGAVILIILSRSGHAAIMFAALAVIGVMWAVRTKVRPQVHLGVLLAAALVLPFVVSMATASLADRLGGASSLGNSSWEDRATSLVLGFKVFAEGGIGTALFGVGPGLSSPAMRELAQLDAVWSVLLSYVYECGLLGIIAVAWVGRDLLRTWNVAGRDIVFALILCVWLVGVTITTSYAQLLTLWIALGWLTVWPSVCERVSYGRASQPKGGAA